MRLLMIMMFQVFLTILAAMIIVSVLKNFGIDVSTPGCIAIGILCGLASFVIALPIAFRK